MDRTDRRTDTTDYYNPPRMRALRVNEEECNMILAVTHLEAPVFFLQCIYIYICDAGFLDSSSGSNSSSSSSLSSSSVQILPHPGFPPTPFTRLPMPLQR